MKGLFVVLALISLILSGRADGRARVGAAPTPAPAGVELGDFLWQGTYYLRARATLDHGDIVVRGAKEGTVRIPVATAPESLKKKLGIAPVAPAEEAFALLNSTEADLTKRFGAPVDTGESDLAPATKRAAYLVQGVRLTVHYWNGRPALIMALKPEGKLSLAEAEKLMARCGSEWKDQGSDVFKSSEGAVAMWMKNTGTLVVHSAAYRAAKH